METKFIYIELKERNGEQEYHHRVVREIPANVKDIEKWADINFAGEFYSNEAEQDGNGYYYFAGSLYVELNKCVEITKEEYTIVNRLFNF